MIVLDTESALIGFATVMPVSWDQIAHLRAAVVDVAKTCIVTMGNALVTLSTLARTVTS